MAEQFPSIIELNVGGKLYTTTLSTLRKYEDSMLAAMFSGRHLVHQDKDGRYMIDCDGKLFGHILEFLRFGTVRPSDVSEALHRYAEYFGLNELSSNLLEYKHVRDASEVSAIKARNPYFSTVINKIIDLLKPVMYGNTANTIIVIVNLCVRSRYMGLASLFSYDGAVIFEKEIIPDAKCVRLKLLTDEIDFSTIKMSELLFVVTHYLQEHGYGKRIGYSCGVSVIPIQFKTCVDFGYIQISMGHAYSHIDLKLTGYHNPW